jgi:seryl-tRNA synthetase
LENFQEDAGVRVPEVLKRFMPVEFSEFIPFVKEAPIDQEETQRQKKQRDGQKSKTKDKEVAEKVAKMTIEDANGVKS